MGVQGRKLTIRMPDNPRLRSAEVGGIHLDPGARVQAGNPVMTLVHRRRDHLVRAPRSGRILPLIATGARVTAGAPLYVLHIDESALEEQNRTEHKALIAVEKEKWTSGVLADAIAPVQRSRSPEPDRVSTFVTNWGKPVLALALYVLACFALLPILSFFGHSASTTTLIAMAVGCAAFGALIYYLYAPEAGVWPRRSVRMVAASWIGISAIALFYQPQDPSDLEFDASASQIAGLFDWSETPLLQTPQATPEPQSVVLAGVAVGPVEAKPAPDLNAPVSVLASVEDTVVPHGITIRAWGRANPVMASGDELDRPQEGTTPRPSRSLSAAVQSVDLALEPSLAPTLSEALRARPSEVERADVSLAGAATQIPAAPLSPPEDAGARADIDGRSASADPRSTGPEVLASTGIATTLDPAAPGGFVAASAATMSDAPIALIQDERAPSSGVLATRHGLPGILPGDPVLARTEPVRPAERLSPALNLYSALLASDEAWIEETPSSTLASDAARAAILGADPSAVRAMRFVSTTTPASEPDDTRPTGPSGPTMLAETIPILKGTQRFLEPRDRPDWSVASASNRARNTKAPDHISESRSPGLILVASLRAGEDVWMRDQSDLLGQALPAPRITGGPEDSDPIRLAALGDNVIAATPGLQRADLAFAREVSFGMTALPVIDGQPRGPSEPPIDLPRLGTDLGNQRAFSANPFTLAAIADPEPRPKPLIHEPEPRIVADVERDLLYLYFDDPRIESHPRMGDPWLGIVSDDLAGAVRSTEVIAVHEILQVQNWCGAANDPNGRKRAALGADYTTAWLNDRIRLLRVRMRVAEDRVSLLEREVPLFNGTPAGFFHNRAPLLGGLPDEPLMKRGRDYLRSLSAGLFDPNAPDQVGGGQYFDSAIALSVVLRGAGCDQAQMNEGAGPSNDIGRTLAERLGG